MAIFEIKENKLEQMEEMKYSTLGILERQDLQQIIKNSFSAIAPDTLIISEEFGDWSDSRRRIDLLGIDRNANLVVIELKRTEDGGHMDLQSIRYAAMISTLTFDKVVEIYQSYLDANNLEIIAEEELLKFLDWTEESEDEFAQDVRIILISANFSKEVTTAVMWLIGKDIDIRCIRIIPYLQEERVLVDIQQIIPLPEITDYQVQLREKERKEKTAKANKKDYTKYDVVIDGELHERLAKRNAIFKVIKALCNKGVSPEQITDLIPWKRHLFRSLPGKLNSEEFQKQIQRVFESRGRRFESRRRFYKDDELVYWEDKTYAMTNQWGPRTKEAIDNLLDEFPDKGIAVVEAN